MVVQYTAKDFLQLLTEIFGPTVVKGILHPNKLQLRHPKELEAFFDTYKRVPEQATEGCHTCESIYNFIHPNKKDNFDERNMDFPSWLGELDFTLQNRKEIMIIGESTTGTLKNKRKIGVAFSLGVKVNKINDHRKITEHYKNFWEKLSTIFENIKDSLLEKLYITDIGKCNANGNPMIFNVCGLKYTIQELRYIHPKLLIFLGHSSRLGLIPIIQSQNDMKIKPINLFPENLYPFYEQSNMCCGDITFVSSNPEPIKYITVPHTTSRSIYSKKNEFWNYLKERITGLGKDLFDIK